MQAIVQPDESALDYFSRVKPRTVCVGIPLLDHRPISTKTGDIIEITGPTSSGKSSLALHCILHTILPRCFTHDDVVIPFNGNNREVLYIDLDGSWDVTRAASLLEQRFREAWPSNGVNSNINATVIQYFVTSCLTRIHVVRCYSASDVYYSVMHWKLRFQHQAWAAPLLGLVVLDSVSTLARIALLDDPFSSSKLSMSLAALQDLSKCGTVVFTTRETQGIYASGPDALGKQWACAITARVQLDIASSAVLVNSHSFGPVRTITFTPSVNSRVCSSIQQTFTISSHGLEFRTL